MEPGNDQGEKTNERGGPHALRHDAVPPYPKVFTVVFAAALLYLVVIFLVGGGEGYGGDH